MRSHVSRSLYSFVHHADVVPLLSLSNVKALLACLRALDAVALSTRSRLSIKTVFAKVSPVRKGALSAALMLRRWLRQHVALACCASMLR